MKKIIVIGSGGAGKSTFSYKLGRILEIPVIHLDRMFWREGWEHISRDEFAQNLEKIYNHDKWIIDGNYASNMHLRMEHADTIIHLDYSRYLCLLNVIKRFLKNWNKTRPDMRDGCPEKIDYEFLKWIWNYPENVKPRMVKCLKSYRGDINYYSFSDRRELNRFLIELENIILIEK